MNFSFKLIKDGITPDIRQAEKQLAEVAPDAYKIFRSHTPIKTGNARRRTVLDNNQIISANYSYATRLEKGASNQAPDGMTKPTLAFVKRRLDKILKGR